MGSNRAREGFASAEVDATVRIAVDESDYVRVGELMAEYVAQLPFELTFQDFGAELATIRQTYGPPQGAAFLVERDGTAGGVCGVSAFRPGIAELKRMYLRAELRGAGLGRLLAEHAMASARRLGYERIRLDTVAALAAATTLYRTMGFVEIEAYRHNPQPDVQFFELELRALARPNPVGAVLVGGASRRMGRDKAGLPLGTHTLSQHVVAALAAAGLSVDLIGTDQDAPGMAGPLAGLVGAMRLHPGADVFVAATDQPYARPATVTHLLQCSGDVVVPVDEVPQTTFALYRDSALPAVERFAAAEPTGSLRTMIADRSLDTTLVPPNVWSEQWGEDGRSWLSLDTPESYASAAAAWPHPPATTLTP